MKTKQDMWNEQNYPSLLSDQPAGVVSILMDKEQYKDFQRTSTLLETLEQYPSSIKSVKIEFVHKMKGPACMPSFQIECACGKDLGLLKFKIQRRIKETLGNFTRVSPPFMWRMCERLGSRKDQKTLS